MGSLRAWGERRQVLLYVAAIALAAAVGALAPAAARLDVAITPVLAALLFVTFLGVPVRHVSRAFRDRRFVATLLVVDFVAAPVVAFALSRVVASDAALLIGVLLVLLTPCVDYVIVFTGLAGGDATRLLAMTPVLMLGQLALLPVWLWLFAGADAVAAIDPRPFAEAFVFLIVVPFAAAALTQVLAARSVRVARTVGAALGAMVPLMMATLFVVVASQVARVGAATVSLLAVVPLFVVFAVVMTLAGEAIGRVARLSGPRRRAVTLSGVTRNSLVVLPLALALPSDLSAAPLVVVTQTLVELLLLVGLVAVLRPRAGASRAA